MRIFILDTKRLLGALQTDQAFVALLRSKKACVFKALYANGTQRQEIINYLLFCQDLIEPVAQKKNLSPIERLF